MFDINSGRWAELWKSIFGVVNGPAAGVEEAIRAAVVLASDRPEFGFTRTEQLFSTPALVTAAVAGERQSIGIVNRVSRSLIVVMGYRAINTATCKFIVGRLPSANFEAGIVTEQVVIGQTDVRFHGPITAPATGTAARLFTRSNVAPLSGTNLTLTIPATQNFFPSRANLPVAILPPNSFLAMEQLADNIATSAEFQGYIVPLSQGERG